MATTKWEKTDILGKILLGLAGLCLSGVLAWGEFENRAREADRKSEEAVRLREENYAREFQTYYSMARRAEPHEQLARSDLDLAGSIAQTLAAEPFSKPFYNDAVLALRARFMPTAAAPSDPLRAPVVSPVALQAGEAAPAPNVSRSSDEWFAVIASYPLTPAGRNLASDLARSVRPTLGCAEVWRTRISQNYAVVAGGKTNRATALSAAQRARRQGVAPDAFTQANREWVQEIACG